MWLKLATKIIESARFSPQNSYLRDYLSVPDLYAHSWQLEDYFEDRGITLENFDPDESYEWLNSATEYQIKDFEKWIFDEGHSDQTNSYYNPPQETMELNKYITTPIWLIHFSDSSWQIGEKGFQYGHPDFEGIHLTTWKTDRQKHKGYNFAFRLDSRDAYKAMIDNKYGKDAVIFKGTGVEVYHIGDEENQIIFWGSDVDKDSIFYLNRSNYWTEEVADANIDPNKIQGDFDYGAFLVYDASGRLQFIGESPEQVAHWIEKGGEQILRNVRKKQHHRGRR